MHLPGSWSVSLIPIFPFPRSFKEHGVPWDPALLPRLQRSALRLLAVHVRHVVARARQHAREAREYELQQQQQQQQPENKEKQQEDAQAAEEGGGQEQQQQRGRRQQRERERERAAAAAAVRGLLDGAVAFAFRVHQLVGAWGWACGSKVVYRHME